MAVNNAELCAVYNRVPPATHLPGSRAANYPCPNRCEVGELKCADERVRVKSNSLVAFIVNGMIRWISVEGNPIDAQFRPELMPTIWTHINLNEQVLTGWGVLDERAVGKTVECSSMPELD